ISGKGVVETENAANGEGAISHVMDFAGGPFFLAIVDVEGTDAQGGGLVGPGFGCSVGGDPGNMTTGAKSNCMDFRRGKKVHTRECKQGCKERSEIFTIGRE